MLLTVFAHILFQLQDNSDTINKTVDIIYMFHMPAFVFISGFFGRSEHSHSFESIIKLIFLYFICNSIMGFIYGFTSLLMPMYSYWYLIALIVWRLTAHRIAKFKEINFILFVIALFVGFYPSVDNTFAAARIICFYPYYMNGYLLDREKSEKLINKKYINRMAVGIASAIAVLLLSAEAYSYFSFTDSALQMEGYDEPIYSFGRIVLYGIAFLAIYALRCLSPDKKIPFLTMLGRNSLWIFVLHRPFTLLLSDYMTDMSDACAVLTALAGTAAICIVSGNDLIAKYLNKFLSQGTAIFTSNDNKKFNISKLAVLGVSLAFIANVLIDAYSGIEAEDLKKLIKGEYSEEHETENNTDEDIIYPVMTAEQKKAFDNAFRITFSGDLILLEDQVKRAYNGTGYDFTDVFEYAEPYISSADYAIGVFEGPMAGEEVGFSSSNFDDGKELYLNFPDSFAEAVKNTGFDLVTTANNHVLDKGEQGALRTLDVLDKIGLEHTGSYKSMEDKQKDHIKIAECGGIKMAVLSYTYGSNYIYDPELTDGSLSYITSVISGTEGERFELLKGRVEQDFRDAKAMSPDLIIVLPHIGTQFSNSPDSEQEVWFDIFKENGADIILGDHPHVAEPVLIENYNGKNVFTAYCPGNFANIYRDNQGDTSMLVDVYIDRDTKQVIGGSVVPLYTHARADGNFRAVPIYDIMNDTELRKQLTTDDIERAAYSNGIVTKVVFGHEMDITSVTERYYFNENGFIRSKSSGLELTEEMRDGLLWSAIERSDSVCFIGDSVTEGTKNGGCPWYEPMEEYFADKKIFNYSKGGCTVSYMTQRTDDIPAAGLYVIALGTNDVRYRDESICAMTPDDYVSEMNGLKEKLSAVSPSAKFIFIAPWYSTDGDPYCSMSYNEKTALNDEYSFALEQYCKNNSVGFINANEYIKNSLSKAPDRRYLLDHIHPNPAEGVRLYSEAVLSAK
ncbi:MAG: CapA family protein [Oscillospiraceae bacterium]|nr:CapA family protein [Oscillospiraceae bacterium]